MTTLWIFFGILAALLGLAFIVRSITHLRHKGTTPHPHRHPPHD